MNEHRCQICGKVFKSLEKKRTYCCRKCMHVGQVGRAKRYSRSGWHKPRKDNNHMHIVDAFLKLGYIVADLSMAGRGIPDIVVASREKGMHFIEIKNPATNYGRHGASYHQMRFAATWPLKVYLVWTTDDVLNFHTGNFDKLKAINQCLD